MIEVIEGLGLGSGKTFFVLTRLVEHWRKGGTAYVIDTMKIHWDKVCAFVRRHHGLILEDDQLRNVSEEKILDIVANTAGGTDEMAVVIVLDEVQGKLNARDWNDRARRPLFDWACQSRHDSNDVWFISQHSHNVDKQVRRLSTFVWRVRNTKNWGANILVFFFQALKIITIGLHPGAFFIVNQYDQDGKTKLGRKMLEHDKELFECYESKSMAGKHRRAGEVIGRRKLARVPGRTKKIFWRWFALGGIGLAIAGCGYVKAHFSPVKLKSVAASAVATKKEDAVRPSIAAVFDVRNETFRSAWGSVLTTDKHVYRVGSMSSDGLVEGIARGVVRVRQPNRRLLFVVTDYDHGLETSKIAVEDVDSGKRAIIVAPNADGTLQTRWGASAAPSATISPQNTIPGVGHSL
jgi:hypothetical protein